MLRRLYLATKLRIDILAQKFINRSHGLLDYSATIHNETLRAGVGTVASSVGNVAKLVLQLPRLDAAQATGDLGSVIFVGDNDSVKIGLFEALFPNGYEETHLGRVVLWSLPSLTRQWLKSNALVTCRVSRFFPWRISVAYAFENNIRVYQIMPIGDSLDELLSGSAKQTLRHKIKRMLKLNYTCRISHSPQDLETFYHRMYIPTARQRHQSRAVIMPYKYFKDLYKIGFLMILSLDGQEIAASICYVKNDMFHFGFMGLMDGNQEWFKHDVNIALYWNMVRYAIEIGTKQFNFTSSEAWVSDGVFQFKQRWHPKVYTDTYVREKILFRADHLSVQWRDRLNEIGFITRVKNKHLRVYVDLPFASVDEARDVAVKLGLDGIQIITTNEHRNHLESALQLDLT